jgi:hypothetical protein
MSNEGNLGKATRHKRLEFRITASSENGGLMHSHERPIVSIRLINFVVCLQDRQTVIFSHS